MAAKNLTEYERMRLENIKRNQEKIAELNIHSKVTQLSAATIKRQRVEKAYKVSSKKKSKSDETPIVTRRSMRTRGIAPESDGLRGDMTDAFTGEGSCKKLFKLILDVEKKSQIGNSVEQLFDEVRSCKKEALKGLKRESSEFVRSAIKPEIDEMKPCKDELSSGLDEGKGKNEFDEVKPIKDEIVSGFKSALDLNSLSLKEKNIAKLSPGRILTVKFLPCDNLRMVMVGNKFGDVAFWNMDSNDGDEDENRGIYLYRPHTGPVSGIVVQQPYLSKIFTSCYHGFLRLMDAEKEMFDLTYSCKVPIYSLSQRPNDPQSLYFAQGHRMVNIWDVRAGKCSAELKLHDSRINSIDFNSMNNNIMATSSSDCSVCLWDLRFMIESEPKALKIVNHKRAVHSAYFSPSGRSLATTSLDDTVGVVSGVNYEDISMISHNNQTYYLVSKFKAIWGWDDSNLFIGNLKRGVDIIAPAQRRSIMTLQSPLMTAVPCTFDAHPCHVGILAGASSGGRVYVWTT